MEKKKILVLTCPFCGQIPRVTKYMESAEISCMNLFCKPAPSVTVNGISVMNDDGKSWHYETSAAMSECETIWNTRF